MSAGRTADPKNWREMRRLLRLNGARPVRVSGSHETWRFRDGESFTVVCNHLNDPVPVGILVRFRRLRDRRGSDAGEEPAPLERTGS